MTQVLKAWLSFLIGIGIILFVSLLFGLSPSEARNIAEYKDTISDSTPLYASNHTLSFILDTSISAGSSFEITMPAEFETLGTSTFSADRNVKLSVDGITRQSSSVASSSADMVEIFPGTPGMIRYTLDPTTGILAGSRLEIKIGNHTDESLKFSEEFSTTTGTSTTFADVKPIINSSSNGTKEIKLEVYDGTLVANAGFLISLIEKTGVGPVDTTEIIPPNLFNAAPTTTVTGVTLSVEIFVESDELAICKFDRIPGTSYSAMPYTFTGTGLIYHTEVVSVTPNSLQQFYIRCMDDEGNYNIEDFLLEFSVSDIPTGTSNTEGDVEGDGSGSGDAGTGTGSGGGGTSGASDGEAPSEGGTAGGGGSGGGGGGGGGVDTGDTAGGGFESTDAPYRGGDGQVVISGLAYPKSTVYVLVDGKAAKNARAGNDGKYEILIDAIARGAYTFGVYAVDPAQTKSSTFSTSFTVSGARTSALSNIILTPTVKITPDPVNPGESLTISGYATPNAQITLENEKDKSSASKQTFNATATDAGLWSVSVNTSSFSAGTYKARAKAKLMSGIETSFSNYTLYGVGQSATKPTSADLNRDGKVNLVDFSIMLFWWNTDGGTSNPSADINSDGKVSLTDFSILLFNWTG